MFVRTYGDMRSVYELIDQIEYLAQPQHVGLHRAFQLGHLLIWWWWSVIGSQPGPIITDLHWKPHIIF